ncbi:hypothetical protein TURU_067372 [Turdus rufiventris]|nr:hypothetical protein TURU_067372 [Turdus rufiventris]
MWARIVPATPLLGPGRLRLGLGPCGSHFLFGKFLNLINILASPECLEFAPLCRSPVTSWQNPSVVAVFETIVLFKSLPKVNVILGCVRRSIAGREQEMIRPQHCAIECTFNKFADDIMLSGAADVPEGQDVVWRDLENLKKWAHIKLIRFNKAVFNALHLDQGKPQYGSRLGNERSKAALLRSTWGCWWMRNWT